MGRRTNACGSHPGGGAGPHIPLHVSGRPRTLGLFGHTGFGSVTVYASFLLKMSFYPKILIPKFHIFSLHSTFRHDLKIYASDEGRVQMTAAAFAKGLLALEGELTPILVQMVKSANTNGLLDNDCDSSKYQNL